MLDGDTLLIVLPIVAGVVAYALRTEGRLSRMEGKIDVIMEYFKLKPKGGE